MGQRRYSFSTKLSLYIIAVTGVVFVVSFAFFFLSARTSVVNEAFAHAYGKIENTSSSITSTLARIEQAVDMSAKLYELHGASADSLHSILELMLASNADIVGASFTFEANHYKELGQYFMPYVYRDGDSLKRMLLGGSDYNYFDMEWYSVPKKTKANYWSEPYFDDGGGGVVMATFTQPLIDDSGVFYGVVTADIALDAFARLVDSTRPYERSYTFMLSRKGYYLSHKLTERVLHETIFSATKNMADTMASHLGRQMISGNIGTCELYNDDTLAHVFYAPIAHTDWSIATVVPQDDMLSELHSMTINIVWGSLFGLLALFGFAVFVIRRVSSPLAQFSTSAHSIATGDFDAKLPRITSRDELGELRTSFEHMQTSLKTYMDELKQQTIKGQQIESEFEIARSIQMGMVPSVFPPFANRNDIDIFAVLQPARAVGGDLYDFFIANNRLYFIIGDASGKGVPAALLMAVTRGIFRSTASYIAQVKMIMTNLNNAIATTNEACMFITAFVGIVDLDSGVMEYCNAGHNVPFIVGAGAIKSDANIALGVVTDFDFKSSKITLKANDTLFLYTDGVNEAKNEAGEQYGQKRMVDAIGNVSQLPSRIVQNVMASVDNFAINCPPHDDITVMAIRYKGAQQRLTLPLHISAAAIAQAAIVDFAGCEDNDIRLAVEEAIVNIVSYSGSTALDMILDRVGDTLIVDIVDNGLFFDPIAAPTPNIKANLSERQIGGLGIFLLKNMVDSVTYVRRGGENVLTLKKSSKLV